MAQLETKLTLPEIGYVRPKQVSYIMGVSRATLYNWIKSGKLPEPRKLGVRMVAWPVEVIRAKIDSGELFV